MPVCLAYETPCGLAARYGKPYDERLMRQDVYMVGLDLGEPAPEIKERYLRGIPDDARVDPWGVATWRSSTNDTYSVYGPLQNMSHPAHLDDFPFPNVPSGRIPALLAESIADLHRKGFAVQGAMSQTIFELAWNMYGMQDLMVAFVENSAFAHRLLDEITIRKQAMSACFANAGVDILRLGDDVGTQRGMLISPETWRRFLKPRLASVIAAARTIRPDIPVFYHSDGDVREIIDELIEIGVTILNPVQPECMDPVEIKQQHGDRLTLWGTLGTQTTLPRGTPEEIRAVVKEYMRRLGPGGGYVIGPTHSINRDVPWENIVAFYEAVQEYGSYTSAGDDYSSCVSLCDSGGRSDG
ncbi:uroporphyrinogen decarboxylase family protein [Verrucomicrobiota bacterium]